jgi:hypothetical protein
LVPRNLNLERVCALAKAAYEHDHQVEPASLDREFAFAGSGSIGTLCEVFCSG